jgi:hypothetical protein
MLDLKFVQTDRLPSPDAGFRHPCRNDGLLAKMRIAGTRLSAVFLPSAAQGLFERTIQVDFPAPGDYHSTVYPRRLDQSWNYQSAN